MDPLNPFDQYEARIKELERQRDALVDACDRLIDCLSDWIKVADRCKDVVDVLKAAIIKAKGKTNG